MMENALSNLISDKTLVQIQGKELILFKKAAISGLGFASFSVLHLVNSIFANGGYLLYDGVMEVFRTYYQNPVIEFGLVLHCIN